MKNEYFKQVTVLKVTKAMSKKGNKMVVFDLADGDRLYKHFLMVNEKYDEKRVKILERFGVESLKDMTGLDVVAYIEEKEEGKYKNYNVKFMCKPKYVGEDKTEQFMLIEEELPF